MTRTLKALRGDEPSPASRRLLLQAGVVDLRELWLLSGPRRRSLRPKEAALLARLAAQPGESVNRDRLLTEVFEYQPGVPTRTLDVTVRRLRAAVERDPGQPEHVVTERGVGLRFEPRPSCWPLDPGLAARHNLQEAPSTLVGRGAQVVEAESAWAAVAEDGEASVLTLTGPAGVGKSRLALELAARHLPGFAAAGGGVWWCDLRGATELLDALERVAAVLGVPLLDSTAELPPDRILAHSLAARGGLLLVLDDAEGVLPVLASTLAGWVHTAPELRILVTSRATVPRCPGQRLVVPPLGRAAALALVEGLGGAGSISPTRIVEGADGLPLALELLVAQARDASPNHPAEVADLPALPEGLRAALDASWERLSLPEQHVLAALSVPSVPVQPADVAALVPPHRRLRPVRLLLATLAARSLLRTTGQGHQLLPSVRRFAATRLDELGTRGEAEVGWAAHLAAVGEELALELDGARGAGALARLGALRRDLRRLARQVEPREPLLAARLDLLRAQEQLRNGPLEPPAHELARWLPDARLPLALRARVGLCRACCLEVAGELELAERAADEVEALLQVGAVPVLGVELALLRARLAEKAGLSAATGEHARQAGAEARRLRLAGARHEAALLEAMGAFIAGHRAVALDAARAVIAAADGAEEAARVLRAHGLAARVLFVERRSLEALTHVDELERLGAGLGLPLERAEAALLRARCLEELEQEAAARAMFERAAGGFARLGARLRVMSCLNPLARLALQAGQLEEAERTAGDLAELAQALGHRGQRAFALQIAGRVAQDRGELDRAAALMEPARALLEELDHPGVFVLLADRGAVRAEAGRWEEAASDFAAAFARAEAVLTPDWRLMLHTRLGLCLLALGRREEAHLKVARASEALSGPLRDEHRAALDIAEAALCGQLEEPQSGSRVVRLTARLARAALQHLAGAEV